MVGGSNGRGRGGKRTHQRTASTPVDFLPPLGNFSCPLVEEGDIEEEEEELLLSTVCVIIAIYVFLFIVVILILILISSPSPTVIRKLQKNEAPSCR